MYCSRVVHSCSKLFKSVQTVFKPNAMLTLVPIHMVGYVNLFFCCGHSVLTISVPVIELVTDRPVYFEGMVAGYIFSMYFLYI